MSEKMKFLVLFLVPSAVVADWMKTDPATRQPAEQKMQAEWQQWTGEHASMILSSEAGGKTKRVTRDGVAEAKNLPRFVTQQIHYTLEAREAEYELLPISIDQGLGVMVWSPLSAGLLSGAFGRGKTPADSRQAAGWSEPPIRDKERLWTIVDALEAIARARGVSVAQVSLAWTLSRPAVVTTPSAVA